MKAEAPTFEAINLLGLILEKTGSAEEKDLLLTAVEALRFIETTGQQYDFEDYRQALRTEGPEMVLASFATREEAEAWLKNHPKPPRRAAVLIADEYHSVYYWRDTHFRKLTSSPTLAFEWPVSPQKPHRYFTQPTRRCGRPRPRRYWRPGAPPYRP